MGTVQSLLRNHEGSISEPFFSFLLPMLEIVVNSALGSVTHPSSR